MAVAGGLHLPRVFGSAAADQLTGLGPAPLVADDLLVAGETVSPPAAASAVPRPVEAPATLHVDLGPRDDWFTEAAVARLTSTPYVVTPRSDRVGIRLESADGSRLERRIGTELESEGIVLGAVQVPPSGQPLIFGVDHPVTGGFPVIAVVRPEDIAACAQLRPGDGVWFASARH
jgi:allophanate hydrolase subunit 2